MEYREKIEAEAPKACREEYLSGMERLIARREEEGTRARDALAADLFAKPEEMRNRFREMLGWPLNARVDFDLRVESELLQEGGECDVYRMRFEILEGLKLTGLFFRLHGDAPRPLVITQHGGGGTPELVSGVYGYTGNYNDLTERTLRCGAHCFAPQLLLWEEKHFGVPYDRQKLDARLKRVGSSVTAVEVFGLSRVLDYFEKQPYVTNFGMIGLSYGGFYTLFAAACDTRIRSAISCSQFAAREKCAWQDWTWRDAAYTFSDAEIACLVWPRRLCIEMGEKDALFDCAWSRSEFERVCRLTAGVGSNWVDFIPFDGIHEFCRDDAPIRRLVQDLQ